MEELILGELTERKISYGIVQPGESTIGGVPVIKVNNIISGLKSIQDLDTTHSENDQKYRKTRLNGGEIIISVVGTIGKTAIVPMDFKGCNLVRATALIDIKDPILSRWVKYYIDSPKGQSYINGNLNTTVQPTLNIKSLVEMPIPFYGREYAEKVVAILSKIDDKIENNRKINDNLEQQAQALYKSWFTDFEPFKNGKFIESELGLIPEGWKVGKIKDIISLLSGFPFKSSDFVQNGDYRLITIKGVQDGYLDVTSADRLSSFPPKMPEYCILNIGDILISLTGNVGRICIVDRNKLLLNQRVAILAPKDPRDSFYTYTMFRSESFKNELIHLARGTAQLNLSPIETGDKLTVIPPDSVLEAFAKISKGTFDQYISIKMENIRLSEMRDTLLPKLISGELKINEIDC